MAYHFDNYDNSIVIDGWEAGIAPSPHIGLADMRNVNIVSVPDEVSVNFATSQISSPQISATITVTGLSSNAISFAAVAGLENGMAIQFTNLGSLTGLSLTATYWCYSAVGFPNTTSVKLYSVFSAPGTASGPVTIGGTAGGATFIVATISNPGGSSTTGPQYFVYANNINAYFMQDGTGQVWTNRFVTGTNSYWMFIGLSGSSDNAGRGLAYYQSTKAGNGFLFAFKRQSIDYFDLQALSWTWGWRPLDAAPHNSNYLNYSGGHEAMLMPTNQLIYCDGQFVGRFYEKNPGVDFDPTSTTTYVWDTTQLLPGFDISQCLTYLGTNILVRGSNNVIYPWNGTSSTFDYPILLPEYNVHRMVTVNTIAYIFVGNRGRIYQTNGTNAALYKKVPDHISGTVEPYFVWGGACSVKNQLYFGLYCITNAGATINQYGGVWAIDMDSGALRLTNKLSYGDYSGFASAMIPNFSTQAAGAGLFIGWGQGAFLNFGIDTTISTPYTGSQATIDSDLIPIGTLNKPRDLTKVEYRLT